MTVSSPTTFTHDPKSRKSSFGQSESGKEKRLIVVSNRLPVTISKDEQGEYHFKVSCTSLGLC